MAAQANDAGGSPIADLNTTPLIDVMLVLLIMFIITMPLATHSVKMDLPGTKTKDVRTTVNPVKNIVGVSAKGAISWNGETVGIAQLRERLAYAARMTVEPVILFQPESEARYELVDLILADIKRSGVSSIGFVGNEQYGAF
ncbi:MAG: biopolymer transporter ExbD [Sphingobium sp.]